jgi:transposase-like protein
MLRLVDESAEMEAAMLPTLDEIAREGARRLLVQALEVEVAEYLETHQARDENGHALVVRNGKARARQITLGSGAVQIQAPRVNDQRLGADGERQRFTSKILPPYMRRSPRVAEVLPVLYLRGLSTGDFREALPVLLGQEAARGLSPTNIVRMTSAWQEEYEAFGKRRLDERDYVYIWVDGIHVNVRLEEDRLCLLVMIGARPDGTKELIAIADGYRESTESWLDLLRDLKARGMQAPVVAVGDGALGFWAALREVWPETREQRDWVHRLANVLDKLPKRLQPKAKAALHEIMYAESRKDAELARDAFVASYESKYPKAVESLQRDGEQLLTFFDFPAEHWKHLRTSNVVESPFATVRLRQRVTKGPGSRNKGLTMAFKLLDMAQKRWRRLNGSELLPLVREGATFVDGIRIERETNPEEERIAA